MNIDRDKFFAKIRTTAFNGNMTQAQVNGCNALIDRWLLLGKDDKRHLAYVLATAKWETAHTMAPVREAFWLSEAWREANLRYYPYYGRGFVQITWKENYEKFGKLLGVDLVSKPDLALDLKVAADIAVVGMEQGLFTGLPLGRYFGAAVDDPLNARRIINGTDKAAEVEIIYRQFWGALL